MFLVVLKYVYMYVNTTYERIISTLSLFGVQSNLDIFSLFSSITNNHCKKFLFVNSAFIRDLFPENLEAEKKGRPTTAGSKIKVRD